MLSRARDLAVGFGLVAWAGSLARCWGSRREHETLPRVHVGTGIRAAGIGARGYVARRSIAGAATSGDIATLNQHHGEEENEGVAENGSVCG